MFSRLVRLVQAVMWMGFTEGDADHVRFFAHFAPERPLTVTFPSC